MLGLLLDGGGTLEQDGRSARLGPGGLVLYTNARPFLLELSGPYWYFVVNLVVRPPRAATADARLGDSAAGRVLAAALGELADHASALGPLSRQSMGGHINDMVDTLLRDARTTPEPTGTALLDRVIEHIDARLADALTPASIAAAHHISVRYLYVLFQRQGLTVGEHVRRRRLEHIRREPADPALADLPAYAIAARWHIGDASHLTKLFRARYGLSPQEFRTNALAPHHRGLDAGPRERS